METPRLDDPERLLNRARHGDEDAVKDLLALYRPYLRLLTRLRDRKNLQSKLDESDLVQDALAQAYQSFATFRGQTEAELTAWMRSILASTTANAVRHYTRRRRDVRLETQYLSSFDESSRAMARTLTIATTSDSPSDHATRRERAVLVAQALEQLPQDYREVLILRELEDQPLSEIARQTGRSTGAVQKLWARAIVRMQQVLGEEP